VTAAFSSVVVAARVGASVCVRLSVPVLRFVLRQHGIAARTIAHLPI
jgi:hypothetical protein